MDNFIHYFIAVFWIGFFSLFISMIYLDIKYREEEL